MLADQHVPPGFRLCPEALTLQEEHRLLEMCEALQFLPTKMRGRALRRQIMSFGAEFGPNFQSLRAAPPIPAAIKVLLDRSARQFGFSSSRFNQALVQRYQVGASIGWHRDAEVFGSVIIGVSAGAVARLRFKREQRSSISVSIPARSMYVLAGEARDLWLHSVAPVQGLRYSVTFREILRCTAGE
jgi:alkylated DNA repair dioxygenase AlkB